MRKTNKKPAPEVVYIGDSGTHYIQADYDKYVFLMQHQGSPILPQKAYFERLDLESYRPINEHRLTTPSVPVLQKLDNRYKLTNE